MCAISDGLFISVLIRPRLEGFCKHIAQLIQGGLLGTFKAIFVKAFLVHLASHAFNDLFTYHTELKPLLLPNVDGFFPVCMFPCILERCPNAGEIERG